MIKRWEIYTVVAVAVLIINIFIIGHYYNKGKDVGAYGEKLTQVNNQIAHNDSVTHNDSVMVSIAQRQSDSTNTRRDVLRNHVKIVHDTVYVEPDSTDTSPQDIPQVLSDNPQIARLITIDDSTINALRRINRDQDKSISDLYNERLLLKQKVTLLESNQHAPRGSWGLQTGVGYCVSSNGNTPCIYAGVGYSVRF